MYGHTIHFITGQDLGISYSSFTQVGSLLTMREWTKTNLRIFYNVSNKNLIVKDHFLHIDEYAGLDIGYYYNSLAGQGVDPWRLNIKKIKKPNRVDNHNTFVLIEEDGHETPYTFDEKAVIYKAPTHGDGTPNFVFDGGLKRWIWRHPKTKKIELYDTDGFLRTRIDSQGRALDYEYENGEIASIKSLVSGNDYQFSRSENALQIYLKEPDGKKTLLQSYEFDHFQRITKTKIPNMKPVVYQYISDTDSRISDIETPDGNLMQPLYDDLDRHSVSTFLLNSNNVTQVEPKGNNEIEITDPMKFKSLLRLDGKFRISEVSQSCDIEGNEYDKTAFEYNEDNQIQTIKPPCGAEEKFIYLKDSDHHFNLMTQHISLDKKETNYYYKIDDEGGMLLIAVGEKEKHSEEKDSKVELLTRYAYENIKLANGLTCHYLRFSLSPAGLLTEHNQNNKGETENTKAYFNNVCPLYLVSGGDAAASLAILKNWADKQKLFSLTKIKRNLRGQVEQKFEYTEVDEKGDGVVNEYTAIDKYQSNIQGTLELTSFKLQKEQKEQKDQEEKSYSTTVTRHDGLQRPIEEIDALNQVTQQGYSDDSQSRYRTTVYPNQREVKDYLDSNNYVIYPLYLKMRQQTFILQEAGTI